MRSWLSVPITMSLPTCIAILKTATMRDYSAIACAIAAPFRWAHQRAMSPAGSLFPLRDKLNGSSGDPSLSCLVGLIRAFMFTYGAVSMVLTVRMRRECRCTQIHAHATAHEAVSDPVSRPRATGRMHPPYRLKPWSGVGW